MLSRIACLAFAGSLAASAASAEFTKVNDRAAFLSLVAGKTLTRPLINLRVTQDGRIEGMGARWEVTGNWSWRGGYFCRDLFWGGDELGYNCQEVRVNRNRLRFTSDRGNGQSAVFKLH